MMTYGKNKLRRFIDYIIMFLLIVVVVLLIQNVKIIKSDGGQCLVKPLNYGVKQLNSNNPTNFTCFCSAQDTRYATLQVTGDSITHVPKSGGTEVSTGNEITLFFKNATY